MGCNRIRHLSLLLFALFFAGCGRPIGFQDDAEIKKNPFDESLRDWKAPTKLSGDDEQALKNAIDEAEETNPENGSELLSAALEAEMKKLFDEKKTQEEFSKQSILLAGKVLAECAEKAAALAPKPGEPLIGRWRGNACDAKTHLGFKVGQRLPNGEYGITGSLKGKMKMATPSSGKVKLSWMGGAGTNKAALFEGKLQEFNGQITTGTFLRENNVCRMKVKQISSENPIPEHFVEGVRRMGRCYTQAMILLSPVMLDFLRNMDPGLALLLRKQMLGLR